MGMGLEHNAGECSIYCTPIVLVTGLFLDLSVQNVMIQLFVSAVPMQRTRSRTEDQKQQQQQPTASGTTPGQWGPGGGGHSSGAGAHNYSGRGVCVCVVPLFPTLHLLLSISVNEV